MLTIHSIEVSKSRPRLASLEVVTGKPDSGLVLDFMNEKKDMVSVAVVFGSRSQRAAILRKLAIEAGAEVDLLKSARTAAEEEVLDFLSMYVSECGTGVAVGPISLDALVGEDDERTLGDAIRDATAKR